MNSAALVGVQTIQLNIKTRYYYYLSVECKFVELKATTCRGQPVSNLQAGSRGSGLGT